MTKRIAAICSALIVGLMPVVASDINVALANEEVTVTEDASDTSALSDVSSEVEDEQDLQQQMSIEADVPLHPQSVAGSIDMNEIFSSWINYPGSALGYAYDAKWSYDAAAGLNTDANVGWTGFYNPAITDFTTGVFEFEMQTRNFDPLGFAWGMQTGGTATNPTYSFYAFEECGHGKWSVAYINDWRPADSIRSHQGPLYHGTIDARDGQYSDHNGGTGKVGFATGTVLKCGDMPANIGSAYTQHRVKIAVKESSVDIYLDDTLLTTVTAAVKAGSFGPFATSNPDAHFMGLSFTTSSKDVLNPKFEYHNAKGEKVAETYVASPVTTPDLSTCENSPITTRVWTVYKDGAEVYTGDSPYSDYHLAAGTYETSLIVINANGIQSTEYRDTLVVKPHSVETTTEESSVSSTPQTPVAATPKPASVKQKAVQTRDSARPVDMISLLALSGGFIIFILKRKFK